jgi:hypothetical protein
MRGAPHWRPLPRVFVLLFDRGCRSVWAVVKQYDAAVLLVSDAGARANAGDGALPCTTPCHPTGTGLNTKDIIFCFFCFFFLFFFWIVFVVFLWLHGTSWTLSNAMTCCPRCEYPLRYVKIVGSVLIRSNVVKIRDLAVTLPIRFIRPDFPFIL